MSEFEATANRTEENEEEDDVAAMLALTAKKKKKRKEVKPVSAASEVDAEGGKRETEIMTSPVASDPPPYSYAQLLQRVVDFLHQNNPELSEPRRATIKPPNILRLGTKKTLWVSRMMIILCDIRI